MRLNVHCAGGGRCEILVIDVVGTKLGYREAGAGATRAVPARRRGRRMDPLLDQLSGGYRVLAPEHPGFGRGQVPDWMMSVGDVAFFYLDLMQALTCAMFISWGTALGGWIAAGDRDPQHRPAGIADAARARRRRDPRSHVRRYLRLDDRGVRAPAIPRPQARAGVAAGAGRARHRHRAAEPHRAGAARLEAAHAQSAIAQLAAPHRCSNIAGLGRGRSGGPVRLRTSRSSAKSGTPSCRACRSPDTRCRSSARTTSARGSRAFFRRRTGHEDVLLPPHALCGTLDLELHRASQLGLGHVAQFLLRSRRSAQKLYPAIIDELELADQLGFDGICVNEHHQTAYGLMPVAQRDRRRAGARDQAGEDRDPRPRAAAGEQSAGGRRGVRHARQHDARAHHHRLRARHRRRILSPAAINPTHSHGALLRGARPDPAGVDRAGAVPLSRPATTSSTTSISGRGRCSSRIRRSGFPRRAARETIEWCAPPRRKYTYLQTFSPVKSAKKAFDLYRQVAGTRGL